MKSRSINRAMFQLREFKSHIPNILGFIAHPISGEGEYYGIIYKENMELSRVAISCKSEAMEPQINIDFTVHYNAFLSGNFVPVSKHNVKNGGFILLYTSVSLEQFSFKLFRQENESTKQVFDSKHLQANDLYTVTLLEPGSYTAKSSEATSIVKIEVAVPKLTKGKPFKVPEPIHIEVSANGFNKTEANLFSSQALVFHLKEKTEIVITHNAGNNNRNPNKNVSLNH